VGVLNLILIYSLPIRGKFDIKFIASATIRLPDIQEENIFSYKLISNIKPDMSDICPVLGLAIEISSIRHSPA
jgi:hypothetical protein